MATEEKIEAREYWDSIYQTRRPHEVSWFQPSLRKSLNLIGATGLLKSSAVVDVGGGASTLVDDLLSLEYSNLTVLDISAEALNQSRERVGIRSERVHWVVADITEFVPPQSAIDLWHDRGLFHFLVGDRERAAYCDVLRNAVRTGGFAIIATFGLNGPTKCSGLDVVRYTPETLQSTIGGSFELIASQVEFHRTPSDVPQEYVYCLFRKLS